MPQSPIVVNNFVADTSALGNASAPLTGNETVSIFQDGTPKKTTVSVLTDAALSGGASGNFSSTGNFTVTVVNGLITNIS